MKSRIYEGHIRHRRFKPIRNEFRYRIFMMYLDLEELPQLFSRRLFWSHDRFNLAFFRRRDHLGDPRRPLELEVRNLVEERTGKRPEGPIRLLTHLRYFGYCFNPISVYYCFDAHDKNVEALVVEVHNTPWGEEHTYVFGDNNDEHAAGNWKRYRFEKLFHVSPFMPMNMSYDMRFLVPGSKLNVHIMSYSSEEKMFDATLTLQHRPITGIGLARVLTAYPLMTFKVTALIYWQAMRLWAKGARFFTHPKFRQSEADEVRT